MALPTGSTSTPASRAPLAADNNTATREVIAAIATLMESTSKSEKMKASRTRTPMARERTLAASADPTVAAGWRRTTWNAPSRISPTVSGRNGITPGLLPTPPVPTGEPYPGGPDGCC
ncbi:MAG: hypothetical protein CSB46_00425 [Micrococcales bacterium]|nr:MAG: hypothetical protein CSB46_00425 [Micrococcales bacterium]